LIKAWKDKSIKEWLFSQEENKLLAVWLLFIFLFYTFSSSKLATYIAPVFLPLALFAGSIFRNYEQDLSEGSRRKKVFYRIAVIFQSLIIIIALFLPPVLKQYSDSEKGLVIMTSGNWWLYILLPLLAAVLMIFLPDLIARKLRRGWFLTIYLLCAVFLASVLLPVNDFLAPYRSARVAKEAISKFVPAGRDLYQYRENFYGIDFYNKIRTPIVEDFGELAEGIAKLPRAEKERYFLSSNEFFQLCAERKNVYCITQHKNKLKEIKEKMPQVDVLWDNGAFYLLHIKN